MDRQVVEKLIPWRVSKKISNSKLLSLIRLMESYLELSKTYGIFLSHLGSTHNKKIKNSQ